MKKICKLIIFVIKITAVASIVNHYVKILASVLKGTKDEDELLYGYHFGNVSYTKKGTGAAMLLLHQPIMNGSKEEWTPLVKELSKTYTVYVPDLPGFGYSDQPEISYSSYLYASFINAFIEDVVKNKAIVMAGGKAADFSVCAAALRPDNFEKLVLISPKGFSEEPLNCPIRAKVKKFVEIPLYGTFVYNMAWLGFFAKNIISTLPNLSLPKTIQSSKFAMLALWNGDLDLNIKDAAKETEIPMFIALGNTDSISGISAGIETRLFCGAKGLPHLGCDSQKFLEEVQGWLGQ